LYVVLFLKRTLAISEGNEEGVGSPNQKGSPVGVTNPIRQTTESQATLVSRLPRETLKKYEGKSREVNEFGDLVVDNERLLWNLNVYSKFCFRI